MTDQPRGMGDNNPPPFESLSIRAEEVMNGARKVLTDHKQVITDPEVGDRLGGFLRQLKDVAKEAEKEREAEKAPHLEAGRAVDSKWKPIKDKLALAIETVEKKVKAHLQYLNEEREKKRKAEEAEKQRLQQEADRKTKEAADLKAKAEAGELKGTNVDPLQAQLDAEAAQQAVKDKTKDVKALEGSAKVGGGFAVGGVQRSVSMRTTYFADIKNAKMLALFFIDEPRVIDVLQALANNYVRAASNTDRDPPPGCTVRKEETPV